LYPEHPTNLVGYHYISTPAGYVFDQQINTAQDLKDNYDYAKRGATLITLRSATVGIGSTVLNGTMNMVRVEGFLTEVPGLNEPDLYNTILTNTVQPTDKIGNVLLQYGTATLAMIGGIAQDYMRLGDLSPAAANVGIFTVNPITIIDRANDLEYFGILQNTAAVPANVDEYVVADTNFNIDSTTGVEYRVNLNASDVPDVPYFVTFHFEFYDPFGNLLTELDNVVATQGFAGDFNVSVTAFSNLPVAIAKGPLGSVRLVVSLNEMTVSANPNFTWGTIHRSFWL